MASLSNIAPAGAAAPAAPADEPLLPDFIVPRADGVFVDTDILASPEVFAGAVDGIFAAGRYFSALDYPAFQRLLYDFERVRGRGLLRLAGGIREFPAARRALYRAVKIIEGEAEYIFEPVLLETTVDEPLHAAGEDGEIRGAGSERRVVSEKASLDVDEFVADLWGKGVRFGIDVAAVRSAIAADRCERVVVARGQAPSPGQDAGIVEQADELHRDNTPRELPNGRVDLGQFKNRFPQMKKGMPLLMKTPTVPGEPGRTIDGQPIAPPLPKDFDLASLAGEGTCLESIGGKDYIVAAIDGFLNLDNQTNRISITEKIVNRDGVSARTTGNLALAGDEYEEFGEVQEGRTVEGKGLTFHADVFGKVVSSGGAIVLERNLVGGTAINRNGPISVAGLASNAMLQTGRGLIRLQRAENCVLIGDRVEVEAAYNCTVLADEVEIAAAEGSAIAGKRIHLGTAQAHSGEETLVSLLLPDLSGVEAEQEKDRAYIGQCEEMIAKLRQGIDQLAAEPELRGYLVLVGKLQRQEITLSAEQQVQYQQLRSRQGPALKRIGQARDEIKSLEAEIVAARVRIAAQDREKEKAGAGLECRIDSVQGEVVVRTLVRPRAATPLNRIPARELKQQLRAPDAGSSRLFADDSGEFAWRPEPPPA